MIVLRLFLAVMAASFLLVIMLGAGLIMAVRHNLKGVLHRRADIRPQKYDGDVIEGEYKVMDEHNPDAR